MSLPFPDFALQDVNNRPGGNPNVVTPDPAHVAEGWGVGEEPPSEYENYLRRYPGSPARTQSV